MQPSVGSHNRVRIPAAQEEEHDTNMTPPVG